MTTTPILAVGISGSPSSTSRSRTLLEAALQAIAGAGGQTRVIDLALLPADALLGRTPSPDLDAALAAVGEAALVVASTPTYRATYTGLLKCFFDQLPLRALSGRVALGIATGGSAGHHSVVDYGLRPLFASLDALVSPHGVFATDAEFTQGVPSDALAARVTSAAVESFHLARALRAASDTPSHPDGVSP